MITKLKETIYTIGYMITAFVLWAVVTFGGTIITFLGFALALIVIVSAVLFSPVLILLSILKGDSSDD